MYPMIFTPEAERPAKFEACLSGPFKTLLGHMERRLPKEGFLLGPKISIYDLSVGTWFAWLSQKKDEGDIFKEFKEKALEMIASDYPNVAAYAQRFREGDLKDHLANRNQCAY